MDSKDLWVELKPDRPSYLVLRGTYGEKVHEHFRMSRQGVRWRFQRISNVYVSSFEALLFVEAILGPSLRDHAVRISRERYDLRQQWREIGPQSADSLTDRRQTLKSAPSGRDPEM